MRSRRLLLLVLLVSLCVPLLPAATSPGPTTLTIVFQGACDFIYDKTSGVTRVVLPAPIPGWEPAKLRIDDHQWFIRYKGMSFAVRNHGSITIADGKGVIPPGRIDSARFNKAVHLMPGRPSEETIQNGLVFELPAGKLVPGSDRGLSFRFATLNIGEVGAGSVESLASEATLTVPIDAAQTSVLLKVGDAEFRLTFDDTAAGKNAVVKIGNLPPDDIFWTGGYQPMCMDTHFLIHYSLVDSATRSAAPPVPYWVSDTCKETKTLASQLHIAPMRLPIAQPVTPMKKTNGDSVNYGNRENCFMARWEI